MASAIDALRAEVDDRLVALPPWLVTEDTRAPGVATRMAARLADAVERASRDEDEEGGSPAGPDAEYLLDLAAHLPSATAEPTLRRALGFRSIRLRTFAAASLLALGCEVEDDVLERIGETPADRALLYIVLATRGLLDAFPARWSTQDALAEADMVRWLQHPTEMGFPPAELALVERAQTPAGVRYLFRFSHPDFLDGDWYVGCAGPYPADEPPSMHFGDAWSEFERFDPGAVERQIGKYLWPTEETSPQT